MAPQPTVEVHLIANPILKDYTAITHEGTKLMCTHFKDCEEAERFIREWIKCTEDFDCPLEPTTVASNITTWIATRK